MRPHANIADLDETMRLYRCCLDAQQQRDYQGQPSTFDALLNQCLDAYLYDLGSVNPDNMLGMFERFHARCYPLPLTRHALESETAGMIPVLVAKMLLGGHRLRPFASSGPTAEWWRFVHAYCDVIVEVCDRHDREWRNTVDKARGHAKMAA